MCEPEHPLSGGNATEGVVRVGDTVRKPWLPTIHSVERYVNRLRAAGIDAPRPLGRDQQGRQIIEFVPGTLALDILPLSDTVLRRVGAMVRNIHDASSGYTDDDADWDVLIPTPNADLICHNDLAPWNLIMGEERYVFIDWDGAGPSTLLWDLAYSAQAFAVLNPSQEVPAAARRLSAFVEGYGADAALRKALPVAMIERTAAMHALLRVSHAGGREPWASMFLNGHGEYWRSASQYVRNNQRSWVEALS